MSRLVNVILAVLLYCIYTYNIPIDLQLVTYMYFRRRLPVLMVWRAIIMSKGRKDLQKKSLQLDKRKLSLYMNSVADLEHWRNRGDRKIRGNIVASF